jgi:hypothetical protein
MVGTGGEGGDISTKKLLKLKKSYQSEKLSEGSTPGGSAEVVPSRDYLLKPRFIN